MRRILHTIAIVTFCLTALALTARAQTTLQIHPDRGVGVLSEDPASGERWSTSIFPFGNYVGPASGEDVFCRTYLRFPLDEIPASSTLQSATLHVYVDDYWPAPGGAPITTYPVAVDWTVEGVDWYDMGAWPALEEGVTTTTVTSDGGWFAWDVTTLVQGWLDGTPNYGLALAAADLGSTASNVLGRTPVGSPLQRPSTAAPRFARGFRSGYITGMCPEWSGRKAAKSKGVRGGQTRPHCESHPSGALPFGGDLGGHRQIFHLSAMSSVGGFAG